MADKRMELMLEIKAKGNQALATIGKVDKALAGVAGLGGKVRGSGGFQLLEKSIGALLAPMRMLIPAGAAVGGALGLAGGLALRSAGKYESLRLQLEAVTGSASEAGKVFKEVSRFAAATPFQLDELVQAKSLLLGVGIAGKSSLESVANAAAGMNRSVLDVASAVASLETEPLRRLGIQLTQNAGTFEYSFRDQMQRAQKIAVEGRENAQAELLKIFDMKFGGATGKLSKSFFGLSSTLRDVFTQSLANIGDGMLPAAKAFVKGISDQLGKLSESGSLSALGVKIGEKLGDVVDHLIAGIQTLPAVFKGIQNLFANGGIGSFLQESFLAGADILATVFLESIKAAANIWVGIGKLISGAFLEDFMASPMGAPFRKAAAKSAYHGLSMQQTDELARQFGATDAMMNTKEHQMAVLRMANKGAGLMASGADQALGAIPSAGAAVMAKARARLGALAGQFSSESGVDVGGIFRNNLAAQRQASAPEMASAVTFNRPTYARDNAGNQVQTGTMVEQGFTAAGQFQAGQSVGGRVVVNVQNLSVRADDPRLVMNKVVRRAFLPVEAAAGT